MRILGVTFARWRSCAMRLPVAICNVNKCQRTVIIYAFKSFNMSKYEKNDGSRLKRRTQKKKGAVVGTKA